MSADSNSTVAPRPSAEAKVISQEIAEFACSFGYEDMTSELREFARYHALDVIGAAFAASQSDFARCAHAGLAPLVERGSSSVIGMAAKLALRDAVLLNGILAHGLDFDDTHTGSQVHPTASAFPCALGLAEFLDMSGRDLLTAYVLGAEIATRLGVAANNTMQAQGFHPTGVVGHLGCTITAAKLYNLDAKQTAMAQGLAGSTASALGEYRSDGSWNKRMHPGWAGVGGITSACLARGGYVGSSKIYEGQDGLFRSHAGHRFDECDLRALTAQLGTVWHVEEAAIKPLPVCHLLHACADSALALRREYDLKTEDILEARALLHPDAFRIVCEPVALRCKPPAQNVAQFSAQFVVAACLVRGRMGFAELDSAALTDPQILELAQRVTYEAYPGSLYPKYLSGGVVVKTRDGRTLTHLEAINRGNGARALSRDDIVAKFMDNAEIAVTRDQAKRIADLVLKCDHLPARQLAQGLSTPAAESDLFGAYA